MGEYHTYIFVAFPFAQIAKYKLSDSVFMTFNRKKNLRKTDNGSQESVDAALETLALFFDAKVI